MSWEGLEEQPVSAALSPSASELGQLLHSSSSHRKYHQERAHYSRPAPGLVRNLSQLFAAGIRILIAFESSFLPSLSRCLGSNPSLGVGAAAEH